MLVQEAMIEKARHICQQDERLVAALLYGSFCRGEGDGFADIEFALFFEDAALHDIDQREWVSQIAPVELYFQDDFGHHTAIFSNLVRGEFHFDPASEIEKVTSWQGNAFFPSLEACVLVDRTGELSRHLQPLLGPPGDLFTSRRINALQMGFINVMLFGSNVLARGELARALELLNWIHRYLLWMVRLVEGQTEHWPTPSSGLEQDISPAAYARFAACTATLDREKVSNAYRAAWNWGRELMAALSIEPDAAPRLDFLDKLSAHLSALWSSEGA